MTYADIKRQLMDGSTDSFFVFSGDELEVQRVYINKIAESKNQRIRRIDTVAEAIRSKGGGLLGQSTCFVCRDDPDFQKDESAWGKVESVLGSNTLIYQITKADKRSKFYKAFEQKIVDFEYMSEPILIKHIKEHINLSTDNCKELIRVCESDYGRILTEIDKVKVLLDAEDNRPLIGAAEHSIQAEMTTNEAFEKLLDDGTIYRPPTDAIFSWVDALLSGKPRLSFRLLEDCKNIGEPALRLLLVLYQGVKRLLQVQSCESKDVTKTTGLTQWEINLVKNHIGVYETRELVDALRHIKSLETGIKTGEIDEEFAVPYAMVSLLSV